MKYIISRTSIWGDKQPHPKAKRITLKKYKDVRSFKNKKEWLERFPMDNDKAQKWGITKSGNPFRIVDGSHITIWIMDIPDLNKFMVKHGEIVLKPKNEEYIGFTNLMEVEIYDGYRE